MAKLTDDEAAQLKALEERRDAPDEPDAPGRSEILNYTIDLADEAAVDRALKLGLLKPSDVEDDDDEDDDGKGDPKDPKRERTPKRRGFFPDS